MDADMFKYFYAIGAVLLAGMAIVQFARRRQMTGKT